jgi:hypothetical protein
MYAKDTKEIKETEKEKEEKKIKTRKGPREPIRPSKHFGLGPPGVKKKTKMVHFLSSSH